MGAANSPLTSNWQSFASGGSNYGRYAKGGVAVVISKSEQKVAFIDLKPLFSYVNSVYFSSNVGTTSNLWARRQPVAVHLHPACPRRCRR